MVLTRLAQISWDFVLFLSSYITVVSITLQSKSSADKRGWSFRKRSARHRVLSNSALSETPSSGIKESPESVTVNFQTQANSNNIPDKIPGMQWVDEKSESVNLKLSDTIVATEDDNKIDVTLDESVIIVIQAAIRSFLARRALLKQKNIVKLQAAVRGHLVRRHAVGTLRCVQAIIKLQALVRARHTRLSIDRSITEEKLNDKHGKYNHISEPLEKENSESKSLVTYTSIEKLLSNRFARQLLESTPRTKPINIKCDTSKSDSAWNWLVRWMSISSVKNEQSQIQLSTEQQELEKVEHSQSLVKTVIPSDSCCKAADSQSSIEEEARVTSESKENLMTYASDSFNFQACQPTSVSVNHSLEQLEPENTGTSNSRENSLDSLLSQTKQPNPVSKMEPSSLSGVPEMENEPPKHVMKKLSYEQHEIEEKKIALGSRKANNPAFIAAQSKFEELSSAAHSIKSASSLNQDIGVKSYIKSVSSATDSAIGTRDADWADNSVDHNLRAQVNGSECGTELSISSTIHSPDRCEVGDRDFEKEANISEGGKSNPKSTKGLDVEVKEESIILGTNLSNSVLVHPAKCDDVNDATANDDPFNSVIGEDSSQVEQRTEKNASDMQIELKSETDQQVYKSSPESSPRSHIIIPEFQGTPSSQVSVKAEKRKREKSGSNRKPRSSSAGKSSISNSNHDSGARSSLELPPKDHKTGKRRNSFGPARPDNVDQEPRDSGSSNSLPNYMLATESARAKVLANSSPRSSPDMQDKDIYIKKRHSLPGAKGRQGSPQMQRSPSQAQQSEKGNGTHLHERKWQR